MEAMYTKEHLKVMMSMDFKTPTERTLKMAQENGIDLDNPKVLEEFKRLQLQNMKDIKYIKEGKMPPNREEQLQKEKEDADAEFQRRLKEAQKPHEDKKTRLDASFKKQEAPKKMTNSPQKP